TCTLNLPPLTPTEYQVVAVLGGDGSSSGITGAEFRIEGGSSLGLTNLMVTPSPAASMATGNPAGEGCDITLSNCASGAIVLLYTITTLAFSPISNGQLRIIQHMNPVDPQFSCPSLVLCDNPMTRICTGAGILCINNGPNDICGTESIVSSSWSAVKG